MTIIFAYTVYALNCPSLNCEFENKTCITDLYGLPYCVYSCSENISGNSIMKAVVGECSFDFKYCNSTTRELESNRCDLCGCPSSKVCVNQSGGYFCKNLCSDGTIEEECSSIQIGKRCVINNETVQPILIGNCSSCGCPENHLCKSDGECAYEFLWIQDNYKDFIKGLFSFISLSPQKAFNLALIGTAFASSTTTEEDYREYPPNVNGINDGKFLQKGPEWVSSSVNDEFVGIQWDQAKTFNKISFVQPIESIYTCKVQYLKDGEWIDLTPIRELPHYSRGINRGNNAESITFDSVESKGVRLFIPKCLPYKCRIVEFSVYDTKKTVLKVNPEEIGVYTSEVYNTNIQNGNSTYHNISFSLLGVIDV